MTKELEKGSVVIGYYLDKDVKKEVSFDLSKRLKNTLILGPTGCGRVEELFYLTLIIYYQTMFMQWLNIIIEK